VAVRLTRLAQEHDAALVVTTDGRGSVLGSAVRIRVEGKGSGVKGRGVGRRVTIHDSRSTIHDRRVPSHESRVALVIEKGGLHRSVEVSCAIEVARRLRAHPEVPDRRGVAKRNRWGELVDSPHRRERATGRGTRDAKRQRRERGDAPGGHVTARSGAAPRQRRFAEPVVRRDEFLVVK
jgi:hypothetical protein